MLITTSIMFSFLLKLLFYKAKFLLKKLIIKKQKLEENEKLKVNLLKVSMYLTSLSRIKKPINVKVV